GRLGAGPARPRPQQLAAIYAARARRYVSLLLDAGKHDGPEIRLGDRYQTGRPADGPSRHRLHRYDRRLRQARRLGWRRRISVLWRPGIYDHESRCDDTGRMGAGLSPGDAAGRHRVLASSEFANRAAGALSPTRNSAAARPNADRNLLREEGADEADARAAADQRHVHDSA